MFANDGGGRQEFAQEFLVALHGTVVPAVHVQFTVPTPHAGLASDEVLQGRQEPGLLPHCHGVGPTGVQLLFVYATTGLTTCAHRAFPHTYPWKLAIPYDPIDRWSSCTSPLSGLVWV